MRLADLQVGEEYAYRPFGVVGPWRVRVLGFDTREKWGQFAGRPMLKNVRGVIVDWPDGYRDMPDGPGWVANPSSFKMTWAQWLELERPHEDRRVSQHNQLVGRLGTLGLEAVVSSPRRQGEITHMIKITGNDAYHRLMEILEHAPPPRSTARSAER